MRRRAVAVAAVLLPLVLAPVLVRGTQGERPVRTVQVQRPTAAAARAASLHRAVSLWLPWWTMPAADASTLADARLVRTASPFWYDVQGDSDVVGRPGSGDRRLVDGWHRAGLQVVPTVTESADGRDFGAMGTSPQRRAAHVRALVALVLSRRYDGLDLDDEQLALFKKHDDVTADRAAQAMTLVAQDTCAALHRLRKTCVVTVMARTDDSRTYFRNILATWVYDYRALSRVADTVRVMAYGEHGPLGPAGPVASLAWVRQVVAYAQRTMPAAKTELGLPAYGQDWSSAGCTGLTSRQAVLRARNHGARVRYDPVAHESTYTYVRDGLRHTVWFADARSIDERAALAVQAGFAGVAIWAAGGEPPSVWPLLRSRFTY